VVRGLRLVRDHQIEVSWVEGEGAVVAVEERQEDAAEVLVGTVAVAALQGGAHRLVQGLLAVARRRAEIPGVRGLPGQHMAEGAEEDLPQQSPFRPRAAALDAGGLAGQGLAQGLDRFGLALDEAPHGSVELPQIVQGDEAPGLFREARVGRHPGTAVVHPPGGTKAVDEILDLARVGLQQPLDVRGQEGEGLVGPGLDLRIAA